VRIELVEALLPDAPGLLDQAERRVEGLPFKVARAELRLPRPGHEAAALEHTRRCFEMPGIDMSDGAASSVTVASTGRRCWRQGLRR